MSWQLWPNWSSLCCFCCCLHQTPGICTSRRPGTLSGDPELLRRLFWKDKQGAGSQQPKVCPAKPPAAGWTPHSDTQRCCCTARAQHDASHRVPACQSPQQAWWNGLVLLAAEQHLRENHGLNVQAVCRVTWSSHSLCHLRSEIIEKEETVGFVCLFGLNMQPVQRSVVKWKTLVEKSWKNETVPREGSSVPQCKIHRPPIPFKALSKQV